MREWEEEMPLKTLCVDIIEGKPFIGFTKYLSFSTHI